MLNNYLEQDTVMQIQCLDENGYWLRRSVFLNMESPIFVKGLRKVIHDKTIPDTYSTVRSVEYA